VASCLEALKARLEREQLGGETISLYLYHARNFLSYLDRQQLSLERVSGQDLDSFLTQRLRSYRKRYGRSPRRLVDWRCTHTAAIHRLLEDAQGQWPPPLPGDADLQRFESHLVEQGRERKYIGVWRGHARQFLDYLNQRGISVVSALSEAAGCPHRASCGATHRGLYSDEGGFETTGGRSAEELFASPEKVFRSDPLFVADVEPELAATGTAGH
jgi:hypothetical protein